MKGLVGLLSNSLKDQQLQYLYSDSETSQSSVALIFKSKNIKQIIEKETLQFKSQFLKNKDRKLSEYIASPSQMSHVETFDDLQLLFIQRAHNKKDLNSGQIAFPGGKNDLKENDFLAAIRETQEEVGIDLVNSNINTYYLGKLPKNVDARKTQDKRILRVSAHIFVIHDPKDLYCNLKVNESEVHDYKWISFVQLITSPQENFIIQEMNPYFVEYFLDVLLGPQPQLKRLAMTYEVKGIFHKIECGMQEKLFGLSFNLLQQLCELIEAHPGTHQKQWPGIGYLAFRVVPFEIKFYGNSYIESRLEQLCKNIYHFHRYKNNQVVQVQQLELEINYLNSLWSKPKL